MRDDALQHEREVKTKLSGPLVLPKWSKPLEAATTADEINPWLALASDGAARISRKRNDGLGKDGSRDDRLDAKLKKDRSNTAASKRAEQNEAEVLIDMSDNLKLPTEKKAKKNTSKKSVAEVPTRSDGEEGSDVEDEPVHVGRGPMAFKQRDLVARAFANDDVVAVRSGSPLGLTTELTTRTGV